MKKILFVLVAGMMMMSCNEAEKTSGSSNTAFSTNTAETTVASNAQNASNNQTSQVDKDKVTKIEWLDGMDKDFGKIKEGENLDVSFRFKNVGTKPLVISRVWAQCGCTVPETPQKPYAPGETGVIKAAFNSTAKVGANTKEVYLTANSDPEMTTLKFHVEVKPKG